MLGVNAPSQISEMKEVLNGLHERYPSAPIMVNSVYHLGPAYGSGTDSMNTGVDTFNQAMKDFCNQNTWAYYVDVTQNLDDGSGYLKSEYSLLIFIKLFPLNSMLPNKPSSLLPSKIKLP